MKMIIQLEHNGKLIVDCTFIMQYPNTHDIDSGMKMAKNEMLNYISPLQN